MRVVLLQRTLDADLHARMLSAQLTTHAARFSSERFVREFNATVNALLRGGAAAGRRVSRP